MGTSITSWENVSAYFTFANNPTALMIIALIVAGIVVGLVVSIVRHENKAFESYK